MTGSRAPHICFVAPNVYPVLAGVRDIPVIGGAEFRQAILARAFAAAGYEVSVITQDLGQPEGEIVNDVHILKTHAPDAGVPILRFIHPRLSSVIRRLRQVGADVYYQSSASHLTGVVAWHCRRAGAKFIYGGASDTDFMRGQERMKYARDRWLFRWGLAHVDAIVAQTARQAALVRKHYRCEAHIIPNPYTLPSRRRERRADLILWVGGIREVKQPDRFIALARALPQYRFRMIGGMVGTDDTARSYFESIRSQAQSVNNLEFLGFLPVEEVEQHFDEAHVFVNTSLHEGFPNTFLQAWARGVPTVSYFDAGVGPDGTRPFLWVANDSDAVAGIAKLVADGFSWRMLSEQCCSQFAARHSTAGVVAAYVTLLQELGVGATGIST